MPRNHADVIHQSAHALVSLDGEGVATLTITDARSMNILSTPVIVDLTGAFGTLRRDPRVRVLILRGSGDKALIGGADIYEMSELTPATAREFITRLRDLCEAVRVFPSPVIARMAGWCLGGGLEVALCTDLRLASAEAQFGMPEVHVGIPSVIHAALMPRLIGTARATWLLMTGDTINAETACAWGLVHEVHVLADLDTAIAARASKLAHLGPQALAQQKALLRSWENLTVPAAIDASVTEFGKAFETGEPQHYMAQFKTRARNR